MGKEVGRGRIEKWEKQGGDKDRRRSVSSVSQESGYCSGHLNGFIDLLVLGREILCLWLKTYMN